MSLDAMKQALEYTRPGAIVPVTPETVKILVDALRLAIEQAEKQIAAQEPVAWANKDDLGKFDMRVRTNCDHYHTVPLYAAPPQRQPLTEEEFDKIENRVYCRTREKGKPLGVYVRELCRAIERKHGIGGGE